jgi:hypothetical protein
MRVRWMVCMIASAAILGLSAASTRAQGNSDQNASVKGSGTVDRIAKWVANREIGDSGIVETGGNVGIGTDTPGSKLTVAGRIEATVSGASAAVVGSSPDATAIVGLSDSGVGVSGKSTALSGVVGTSDTGSGVFGKSMSLIGVHGIIDFSSTSTTTIGVRGFSTHGFGVVGQSTSGTGVFGSSATGLAGSFHGNVAVTGTLSKGGGSFKIDHPLDPENKYLYHSFVESPDMMNIYNGNVVTDENGEAVVELPAYFQALNRDFRYQLTVIGTFAQAIVGEKVKGNRFKIKTNSPGVEVSWQVTGIRQDAWANKNRIPVEEAKSDQERGLYLHPEAFDQPQERGIESARNRELTERLKQESTQRKQGLN